MTLPNKTIYVAEDDLDLCDRAQELAGGNLSAAVVLALRQFVDDQSARREGFQEITLSVGKPGERTLKTFWGRHIARWFEPEAEARRFAVLTVYKTRRGRLAVHKREIEARHPWWTDPSAWGEAEVRQDAVDPASVHEGRGHRDGRHRRGGPWWKEGMGWSGAWRDPRRFRELLGLDLSTSSLEVYGDLDELKAHVPDGLWRMVADAEGEKPVEILDI